MRVNGGSNSKTHANGGITVGGVASGGHRGGKGRQGSQQPGGNQNEKLTEQLEKKLLANGFCREGWMESERYIQAPNASVRGECNETAADRDRQNFPNTANNTS